MQDNSNTPPFAIGQKVVAIKSAASISHPQIKIEKGVVYSVKGIRKCSCGYWKVDVGLPHSSVYSSCGICGHRINSDTLWAGATLFAPIETQYADITKELADSVKETSEVPDKILIPETANN